MTLKPDLTTDALAAAAAWLERWASHVGSCKGGNACECGLARARYEAETALAAAREEARPDPRPSPVGREEVARWICRTVRIAQGFKGTAEYTLDDEVHNAWDDWLDEADDLLALFSPADGWRPIETAPKDGTLILAGYRGHDVAVVVGWQSDPDVNGWVTGETNNDGSYATFDVDCWQPLPAAPPPPGGQG